MNFSEAHRAISVWLVIVFVVVECISAAAFRLGSVHLSKSPLIQAKAMSLQSTWTSLEISLPLPTKKTGNLF